MNDLSTHWRVWLHPGDEASKAVKAACSARTSAAGVRTSTTANPLLVSCRRCWKVEGLRTAAHKHLLKRCPTCGAEYNLDAWERRGRGKLVEVLVLFSGVQNVEFHEEKPCTCGTPLQVRYNDLEALKEGLKG